MVVRCYVFPAHGTSSLLSTSLCAAGARGAGAITKQAGSRSLSSRWWLTLPWLENAGPKDYFPIYLVLEAPFSSGSRWLQLPLKNALGTCNSPSNQV